MTEDEIEQQQQPETETYENEEEEEELVFENGETKYLRTALHLADVEFVLDLAFTHDFLKYFAITNKSNQYATLAFEKTMNTITQMKCELQTWKSTIDLTTLKAFEKLKETSEIIKEENPTVDSHHLWWHTSINEAFNEFNQQFADFLNIDLLKRTLRKSIVSSEATKQLTEEELHEVVGAFIGTFRITRKTIVNQFISELRLFIVDQKRNIEQFSILNQVHNCLQTLFTTTVLCENSFSRFKLVFSERRTRLSDESVEIAMFLAVWNMISSENIKETARYVVRKRYFAMEE